MECRGHIRGSAGNYLCDFSKKASRANAFIAELWGVYEGLKLAQNRGFKVVIVQVDSQVIVNILKGKKDGSAQGWSLVRKIRLLFSADWRTKVFHVYREANIWAHMLAKMAINLDGECVMFEHPQVELSQLLEADRRTVSTLDHLVAL